MVNVIGTCKVRKSLSERSTTAYPVANPEDLCGKTLRVVCRNTRGDCLCLDDEGTALADIALEDVEKFSPYERSVPTQTSPMGELFAPLQAMPKFSAEILETLEQQEKTDEH